MHQLISKQKGISYTKRSSCKHLLYTHGKANTHTSCEEIYSCGIGSTRFQLLVYDSFSLSMCVYLYKSLHIAYSSLSLYRLLVPCCCVLYTPRTDGDDLNTSSKALQQLWPPSPSTRKRVGSISRDELMTNDCMSSSSRLHIDHKQPRLHTTANPRPG